MGPGRVQGTALSYVALVLPPRASCPWGLLSPSWSPTFPIGASCLLCPSGWLQQGPWCYSVSKAHGIK